MELQTQAVAVAEDIRLAVMADQVLLLFVILALETLQAVQ
jgi:hypothetical protein